MLTLSYSDLDVAIQQSKKANSVSQNTPPLIAEMEKILKNRHEKINANRRTNDQENVRKSGTFLEVDELIIIARFFEQDSNCFKNLGITAHSFSESTSKAFGYLKQFDLLNSVCLKKTDTLVYFEWLQVCNALSRLGLLNKSNLVKFIKVYGATVYGLRSKICDSINMLDKFHERFASVDYHQMIFDEITQVKSDQAIIKSLISTFMTKRIYSEEYYISQENLPTWLMYFKLINKVNHGYLVEIVGYMSRRVSDKIIIKSIYDMLDKDPTAAKKCAELIHSSKEPHNTCIQTSLIALHKERDLRNSPSQINQPTPVERVQQTASSELKRKV